MLRRGKVNYSSQTMKKFDDFMRKRTEKKSILQSSNESIDRKLLCFQELLTLTKAGGILAHSTPIPAQPHRHASHQQILQVDSKDSEQNSEAALNKLDRMVYDVNEWQTSKKSSKHGDYFKQIKDQLNPSELKFRKFHHNSTKVSRVAPIVSEIAQQSGSQQNKHYLPMRRKNINNMPKQPRCGRAPQWITMTPTLKIQSQIEDFSKLKQQIVDLEQKAKHCYGLEFTNKQTPQSQEDCEQQQQTKELLRAASMKEIIRTKLDNNDYQRLVQLHTKADSSVPASLLGIVRGSSSKGRRSGGGEGSWSRYIRV